MSLKYSKCIISGGAFYLAGLIMLLLADTYASNVFGVLSPFFIILGWAFIIIHILKNE